VAEAKALMRDLAGRVTPEQVELAIDALARRWQSDEAREGVGAFFDKRAPSWQ
jgi:methylglutaconyl-CoA hydratase